jgi:hypothetical protein
VRFDSCDNAKNRTGYLAGFGARFRPVVAFPLRDRSLSANTASIKVFSLLVHLMTQPVRWVVRQLAAIGGYDVAFTPHRYRGYGWGSFWLWLWQ